MTHPRKVIRETVTAAIIAGATAAAERVWPAREPPIDVETVLMEQGAVILVYTRRDRSPKDSFSNTGTGWSKRECDLHVEITTVGGDDDIDAIAEDVENILDALEIPTQRATEIRHSETEIESTTEFERPVAGALLTYEVCYWKPWRTEPEEEDFFPSLVSARVRGDTGEVVADCDDCEECPPGGRA